MDSVLNALRQTSKGRLEYDTQWKEEGRTKEIVNSIKQSLSTLKLSTKDYTHDRILFRIGSEISSTEDNSEIDLCSSNCATDYNDNQSFNSPNKSVSNNVKELKNIELEVYEKQREEDVKKRVENMCQNLYCKNDSLLENVEDEMRIIQKKYLLMSIKKQKQYEEEYQHLEQELEQMKQKQNNGNAVKSSNLKLLEIEEKHKLLLRQEEKKRQQQEDFRCKLSEYRAQCNNIINECDRKLISFQSNNNSDDIQHLHTLLVSCSQDIEMLLLSKSQFTFEDVKFAEERLLQSTIIHEKLCQHQQQIQQRSVPPITTNVSTMNVPIQEPVANVTDNVLVKQKPSVVSSVTKGNDCDNSKQLYITKQMELIKFEERCKRFADNSANRERKTQIQLFIRTIINTISNISTEHLKDRLNRLLHLFSEKSFDYKGKRISCSSNDYSLDFAMNIAVKSFLSVACKQKNICMMLGPVIVILWSNYPKFGDVFLSHLYLTCPYAVPYYPVRQKDQSDIEYLVTCGYQLDKEGNLESDETFHNRMYPLIELYSAIIQCNLTEAHPCDINVAWRWLALMLNQEPRPGITALTLDAFLSVASQKLYVVYAKQFTKLIKFINSKYLKSIESITELTERQTLMKFKSLMNSIVKKLNSRDPSNALAPSGLVPNYFFAKSFIFMSSR